MRHGSFGGACACTIAFAAGLVLTASGTALATPPSQADLAAARALFKDAEADEQGGRWAEALEKLHRASTVKMTPGLRFHIALCEEKLGQLVAAFSDYTAAQVAARATDNREVLGLVSEPLLSLKVRIPTLTINVPAAFAAGASRAEVHVDGALLPAASLGAPLPVDLGTHTIQASAPGQTPYAVTITVVERQAQSVDVRFVPLAVAAGPIVTPGPQAQPAAATDATHRSHTLAIVATAGAVVLVAGGIGAYAAAGSDQSYWLNYCHGNPQQPCSGNPTPIRTWDAVALGAWLAGAGAGIAAVVLWVRPGGLTQGHEASGVSGMELRGGPGTLWLTGQF